MANDTSTDDDVLEEARKRYDLCCDAWDDNITNAVDDLKFLSGEQWDPQDEARRSLDGRPCLTINKLPTFLHQVTNDQRQNKTSIKVHPVDDEADVEVAEIEQGLIRHIEYSSNAGVAYTTAINSAAAIGFGFYRLTTEYCDPTSFNQEIKFKRIRNALSVKIDPLSQELDGSDMQYCFIESQMAKSEFEKQYPDADATDNSVFNVNTYPQWWQDETVLVCEYYRIEKVKATICLLMDGSSGYKEDLPTPIPDGIIKQERESYRKRVMWYKITGVDILESTEIKCDWIPVFPVYGDEIDIEGKVIRSGLVRYSKDPARMYNYWMTSATEEVAMRNKTPYIGAEGQFSGYEDEWGTANTVTYSYLQYVPVSSDGNLVPAPQRQPMADVPQGVLAMALHANDNIKATTGLFDSSLGARGNATSGKQEIAQQRQGDTANYHYTDNANTTQRHCGRCLVSMIPHYYDAEQTLRLLGEDNTASHVQVNQQIPPQQDPETGAIKTVLNDLTVGEYDITLSTGPGYDTMRQEAAEFFASAMASAKDPVTSAVVTYLAMKNQDVPGGEEAAEMLKKLIPPGIAPQDEEQQQPMVQTPQGPIPVDQAGQAIQMLTQQLQQMHEQLQQADVQGQQLQQEELRLKEAEVHIKMQEVQVKEYEAQTDRIAANADLLRAQNEPAAKEFEENRIFQSDKYRADADVEIARTTATPTESVEKPAQPLNLTIPVTIGGQGVIKQGTITTDSGRTYTMVAREEPI